MSTDIDAMRKEWRQALAELPSTPDNIPAFYLAHGQPMLIWPTSLPPPTNRMGGLVAWGGANGPLAQFLDDFGPVLLEKYKPRGIVVFSAHWETAGERLVTDYGNENPLLMDYYNFVPELYKVEFHSRGDSALTQQILDALKRADIPARSTAITEPRGQDGRPTAGIPLPSTGKHAGLDHGVFVPFIRMFGTKLPDNLPLVQVSIDESLDPKKNWALGEAVAKLRTEGYLIISGGLTVHTFENNFEGFHPNTAKPIIKEFDNAVIEAAEIQDPANRQKALFELTSHPGFRTAHPREEHFVPLYIAAGAGEGGDGSKVLSRIYGQSSFAFGL